MGFKKKKKEKKGVIFTEKRKEKDLPTWEDN